MIALDLFCGAGGISRGLENAGFTEIIGVDINLQPNYPYDFICEDAVEFMSYGLDYWDAIFASPPCQAYSWSSACRRNDGYEYPDLIEVTRDYLEKSGKPYIIENVVGAPLNNPVVLCGTMFPGLKVFRHRLFESNIPLKVEMKCSHEGHKAKERRADNGDFFTVAGHWCGTLMEWSDAMGIDWMTRKEIVEAIPPAYSEYLGRQVIEYISNSNDRKS
jgi:DNA (cytosine-5)-methyltransferase 1